MHKLGLIDDETYQAILDSLYLLSKGQLKTLAEAVCFETNNRPVE